MSLTSTELNYLIWRYLQESGFDLAAYALEKHANCSMYENDNLQMISRIEPGCLVGLVQKGILFSLAQEEVSTDAKDDRLTLFGALVQEEMERRKQQNGKVDLLLSEGGTSNRFQLKSENVEPGDVNMKDVENINDISDNYNKTNINTNNSNAKDNTNNDDDKTNDDTNTNTTTNNTNNNINTTNNNTNNNITMQKLPINNVDFETKILKSTISFEESLACDWHPTIDVFAYGKQDSNAVINAINSEGKITESVTLNHSNVIQQSQNEINMITWAPQGNLIVTAGINGELRAWSPDGKLINIANSYNEDLLATTTATTNNNSPKGSSIIIKLIWCESGQFLLSIDSFMQVSLWDGTNLNPIKQISPPIESPENFIIDACWLGDSKFAVSTLRNSIKVYSITPFGSTYDLQSIGYLPGHDNIISQLILDQSSRLLASSSDYDYHIKIWTNGLSQDCLDVNMATTKQVKLHTSPIISMYWLHDKNNDSYLLTLSMEGVVNIWNGKSGQNILSLEIFKHQANFKLPMNNKQVEGSLIFNSTISPNNKVLAIGNDFGGVSFWDIDLANYDLDNSNQILPCLGVYDPQLVQDNAKTNVGICDLKWDSKSSKVCVSYRGINSVVIDWD